MARSTALSTCRTSRARCRCTSWCRAQDYYLGIFLTGAYQETLGDLHNLFGDTHVVHVGLDGEQGWRIEETVEGDTAAEVLSYLQYDVDALWARLEASCRRAVELDRVE